MTEQCGFRCGVYERLDPARLPPMYLAFRRDAAKPVQTVHSDLRLRFQRGDPDVLAAMQRFAALTIEAREALAKRIIESASRGERDLEKLIEYALGRNDATVDGS